MNLNIKKTGIFFSKFLSIVVAFNFLFSSFFVGIGVAQDFSGLSGSFQASTPNTSPERVKSAALSKVLGRYNRRVDTRIFSREDAERAVLTEEISDQKIKNLRRLVQSDALQDSVRALQDLNLAYLSQKRNVTDSRSAYPREGLNQRSFTQPTNIGFYVQLLANIAAGDIRTIHMKPEEATRTLYRIANALLQDQKQLGYKGLLPWMSFSGKKRIRDRGEYGQQVVLGDNANLSASLGAAIGALLNTKLRNDLKVEDIISSLEKFLDRQKEGYKFLYDLEKGRFRRGWNFSKNKWIEGHHDYFADEFRSGILFLKLRYNFPESVFSKLELRMKKYTFSNGEEAYAVVPYCGGAFQMLWPGLTMPEASIFGLNRMLETFVDISLDFSRANKLPGFLSASYDMTCKGGRCYSEYAGNAGLEALTMNAEPRNEKVASLYNLGAALTISPEKTAPFLKEIFKNHSGLITRHGLWEGYDTESGKIITEQIVANVSTFSLGLAGTGPMHMKRYFQNRGLYPEFKAMFKQGDLIDLIRKSNNSFTWGGSGFQQASEYKISAEKQGTVGTAFTYDDGVNISGRRLRLVYRSNQKIKNAKLEFKTRDRGTLYHQLVIENVSLEQTFMPTNVVFDLPTTKGLSKIDEVVLVLDSPKIPLKLKLFEMKTIQ